MQIKTQRLTLELSRNEIPGIHPRLRLRPGAYQADDVPAHRRPSGNGTLPQKCEAEAAKERPQFYETAVLLDGRHIGSVSAYLEENGTAWELGWIISREAHGCGYAAEAARALMEYCLETTGIRRFIAHCDSENSASQRVMQKLGLRFAEEHSGRKNRGSDEVRSEMMFERVF
ncbi:MAG: GNAT family N-acetyltransferase [Oscillospiraceae bacterium]